MDMMRIRRNFRSSLIVRTPRSSLLTAHTRKSMRSDPHYNYALCSQEAWTPVAHNMTPIAPHYHPKYDLLTSLILMVANWKNHRNDWTLASGHFI